MHAYLEDGCVRDVLLRAHLNTGVMSYVFLDQGDLIFMLGGSTRTNRTGANDVWASSDHGRSWVQRPQPSWSPRNGHAAVAEQVRLLRR